MYELHGHRSKVFCKNIFSTKSLSLLQVTALAYSGQHSRLLSTGEDSRLVCWNMEMPRLDKWDIFRLNLKFIGICNMYNLCIFSLFKCE